MELPGIILALLGVFVLLSGAAMDTTETRQSCVEYESTWGDGYSCTEYQYSNPFPSIAAMTLGLGMIIGGVIVATRSGTSKQPSSASSFSLFDEEANFEQASKREADSDDRPQRNTTGKSLADQLRERQED